MIKWEDIDLKGHTSGQHYYTCPACSEARKKKTQKCLSVNIDEGVAKCHHCEDFSLRDFEENTKTKKEYTLPNQEWQNYTQISDKLVNWFSDRGISQRTLIECKITEEVKYQPAKSKEMNCITFNYFEGDKLVNKKYRSAQKDFTQEKNAKKIFYGINDVIGCEECYIVEGEMDKLALWEIGVKNVISVPNGAKDDSDYFEHAEPFIKRIKKFFIAVDMDAPGEDLEQSLIKRLGKHRCQRIRFKNKDANDDLKESRLILEESISKKFDYPVDGTFTAFDIFDDIVDLYNNGYAKVIKASDRFKRFNEVFSVIPGQLTTVTGIPSHGKSNFIESYIVDIVATQGKKASFYSPEHYPMQLHQSIISEKVTGKPFMGSFEGNERVTIKELEEYRDWSKDKIYLTIPEKAEVPNWDWLFNKFEEQIYRFGIDIFVIDAWNKVKLNNGTLLEMNEVLARLTLFCQMHNTNIFLIAHPTKMKKDEKTGIFQVPTLYDVKGTGDFYDQTHNGLTVYRVFENENEEGYTKVIPTKIKFKHQGKIGEEIIFRYNKSNGRFYEFNDYPDNSSYIEDEKPRIIDSFHGQNGLSKFEEDVPF